MTVRRTSYNLLNRGQAGRALIAKLRSVALRRRGDITRVRYDAQSRGWVHTTAQGTLVLAEPSGRGVGEFAELTRDVFLQTYSPTPGDVVLDIGAGVGTETLTFGQLVGPAGRVVAVEAHPTTFDLLTRTVELSHLDQVTCLNAAVMDAAGPVSISDMGPELTHINRVGEGSVTVPGLTIADIARTHDLGRINFLKMNIEGAETAALRGAGDVLQRTDHLAIGCHDFLADETGDESYRTLEDVRQLLEDAGFTVTRRGDDDRPWARDYLFASR